MSDTMRYERKYRLEGEHPQSVLAIVSRHPAMFREIYRRRWINNIYLDDPMLSAVTSNVDGLAQRRKLRVRWYGDLEGDLERPILEVKLRRGTVGSKLSFALPACRMADDACATRFDALVRRSALPRGVRQALLGLRPALLNRYARRYFLSADGRFRLTLDVDMTFHAVPDATGRLGRPRADARALVLELKYAPEDDPDARRVGSWFPFRITRNSKYVHGMSLVNPALRDVA